MTQHLHTLPILERWDCHHCTACCRETTIVLNANDLSRLDEQRWGEHPEYRGVRTVQRSSWLAGQQVLAHQPDGSCVFLTAAGLCRIHEKFGPEAKPLMCRQFPLQVVTTSRGPVATMVRSCPSAAADRGSAIDKHLPSVRKLFVDKIADGRETSPPPISRDVVRNWKDFDAVAEALERIVTDSGLPLVRRLVHGLRFCELLAQCKWKRIESESVAELASVLERSAADNVSELFQQRCPPAPKAARLFRRLGAHFVRCVPGSPPNRTWRDHWRAFRFSGQLARAQSQVPAIHPRFPRAEIDELERPLGPLPAEVLLPLERFFEAHALSKRFVINSPRRSLVEGYRCLAFTYPMALWLLRWLTAGRSLTDDDTVTIVVALERGLALPALTPATGYLVDSGELERMIAWYGR
jgi:lysine-N-methylase